MKVLLGMILAVLLAALGAAAFVWSGAFDMSATRPPSPIERLVGNTLLDRSVERRAPRGRNPLASTPDVLREGLAHYREHCLLCHGAPGVEPGDAAKGLNPPAPDLTRRAVQSSADGELFQVIAHGVRMTGMPGWLPTHPDRDIWELVAFVRHLPAITDAERAALARGAEEPEGEPRGAAAAHGGAAEPPASHGR